MFRKGSGGGGGAEDVVNHDVGVDGVGVSGTISSFAFEGGEWT